jgi:hypothetical protein
LQQNREVAVKIQKIQKKALDAVTKEVRGWDMGVSGKGGKKSLWVADHRILYKNSVPGLPADWTA